MLLKHCDIVVVKGPDLFSYIGHYFHYYYVFVWLYLMIKIRGRRQLTVHNMVTRGCERPTEGAVHTLQLRMNRYPYLSLLMFSFHRG